MALSQDQKIDFLDSLNGRTIRQALKDLRNLARHHGDGQGCANLINFGSGLDSVVTIGSGNTQWSISSVIVRKDNTPHIFLSGGGKFRHFHDGSKNQRSVLHVNDVKAKRWIRVVS